MDAKLIMGKIFSFVDENYNRGKKIANHTTWFTLAGFFVVATMIINGHIETDDFEMLVEWAKVYQWFFWAILGLRVGGGGFKTYVEYKHGRGNGAKKNKTPGGA